LIDYVSVSLGVYQTLYKVIGGMHEPSGYELKTSETITRNIRIPTMVVGRIRTLDEADRIISSGAADLVGFTRATIADADLVRKSLRGQGNRVRPCIGCNQSCIGGLYAGRLGCAVNPAVGFESILGEERRTAAPRSRRILVVGAGPAGMEAARVARLRGHDVILAEAEPVVGGALRFAARAPTRHAFADLIAWQERELQHLGVELRLSTSIGIEDVRAEKPDCVIVATGSSPRRDGVQLSNPGEPIDGMDRVLSSWDVFSAPERVLGRTAVVIDDLGHYEAVAVAEHLATRGVRVTFVSRFAAFAPQMETSLMTVPALQRLNQYPFDIRLRTRIIAVDDEGVVAGPVYLSRDSHAVQKIAAETVVFVSHNRANRELYTRLAECGTEAHVIGDGNSPRFLPVAMREGHQVGNQV
jgi:NADPH-dependent 2,4-dienoyl-CoA reductase/sulfur reductase-like enzyme